MQWRRVRCARVGDGESLRPDNPVLCRQCQFLLTHSPLGSQLQGSAGQCSRFWSWKSGHRTAGWIEYGEIVGNGGTGETPTSECEDIVPKVPDRRQLRRW